MHYLCFQIFKKRTCFLISLLLAGILLSLSLSQCQKKNVRDNFILITLDTQRADFISSYSPANASTPHIDFLAKNGILYENCYSLIPITLPSHASIFFSEPPYKIKNYNNGQIIRKKRKRPSFVQLFKKNDFQTAAFVSLGILQSEYGLDEGFDLYKDDFPEERWYLTAQEVNQNVFSWLEQNKDYKFFLWIHYSDPHDPYSPPDLPPDLKLFLNDQLLNEFSLNKYIEYKVNLNLNKGRNRIRFEVNDEFSENNDSFQARLDKLNFTPHPGENDMDINFFQGWAIRKQEGVFFLKKHAIIDIDNYVAPRQVKLAFRGNLILSREKAREFYKREVEYMDEEIGKLWDKLRELKLFRKTHTLIVGDHGEGLGEYSAKLGGPHFGHIHFLYNIYMKVPLIIYNPRTSEKGIRREEPVTLLDIAPTIIQIMGFKNLRHFQGRNLLRLEKGEKLTIYEETYRPEAVKNKFALLQFPWHLILTPEEQKYELFHLEKDHEEKENIYKEKHPASDVALLKEKLDSFAREILKRKEEIKIDKKTEEMLRSLGYIK